MTQASKEAFARDLGICQWHKWVLGQEVHVFQYQPLFHHYMLAGTHHCLGRARVDTPETIITLCADCHGYAESHRIKKIELVALLSSIVGVDLNAKYPQYCKWSQAEWEEVYGRTATKVMEG